MIAVACVSAHLDPRAFGVDETDVHIIAAQMLQVIEEQAESEQREYLKAKARGDG